jgi:hypothetical protein
MAKGGGGKQVVVDYALTVHYGVCYGPVDGIRRIEIGDKNIGIDEITGNDVITVDNINLFGGPKKGGGIRGRIHVFFGGPTQLMSEEIAAKYSRTPTTMTGYRDLLTLCFTALTGNTGFVWGANQPSVPAVAVTPWRMPRGLDEDGMIGENANPAHMVYECLHNNQWGAGYPEDSFNEATFLDAAELFRDENFGLSMVWTGSTPFEDYVNNILKHVSANLTFNLSTAKWEIKPLRGDYDPVVLREINPSNARLLQFERKGWGETINQIVLSYTNPANEKTETVTREDSGNISIQGGVISDSSRNFTGIRSQSLALTVAERELRQAAAPLASAEVEMDRSFSGVGNGDVVRFVWPPLGIVDAVAFRVVNIGFGERGDSKVKVTLLEDIFSFGVSLTEDQDGEGGEESADPEDIPDYLIETAPYYVVASAVGETAAGLMPYPEVLSMVFADPNTGDIREIDVLGKVVSPSGVTTFEDIATIDELVKFITTVAMVAEVTTVFSLPVGYSGVRPIADAFMLFRDPADQSIQEIGLVVSVVGTTVTIRRGVLDTTPQAWPIGTIVWVVNPSKRILEGESRAAAETVEYKLLPITSLGRLAEADATTRTRVMTDRPHLPLRPANVKLDGGPIPATTAARVGDRTLTWATRNRLTETSLILAWDDASAVAEVGQTTTIKIYNGVTLLTTISGLTGTSQAITQAQFGNPANYDVRRIELYSVRGGLESLQKADITVTFRGDNMFAYSHDFSQWGANAGHTAGAVDGPISGVLGASKIKSLAGPATVHYKTRTATLVAGQEYTFSAVLKAAEVSGARLYATGGGQSTVGRTFDLSAGSHSAFSGTPTNSSITAIAGSGGGWYRCEFSFIAGVSASVSFLIRLGVADFTGNAVDGIYADHAQLEIGSPFSGYYVRKP